MRCPGVPLTLGHRHVVPKPDALRMSLGEESPGQDVEVPRGDRADGKRALADFTVVSPHVASRLRVFGISRAVPREKSSCVTCRLRPRSLGWLVDPLRETWKILKRELQDDARRIAAALDDQPLARLGPLRREVQSLRGRIGLRSFLLNRFDEWSNCGRTTSEDRGEGSSGLHREPARGWGPGRHLSRQ